MTFLLPFFRTIASLWSDIVQLLNAIMVFIINAVFFVVNTYVRYF